MLVFMHVVERFKVRLGGAEMSKETSGNAVLLTLTLDFKRYVTIKWPQSTLLRRILYL